MDKYTSMTGYELRTVFFKRYGFDGLITVSLKLILFQSKGVECDHVHSQKKARRFNELRKPEMKDDKLNNK